MSSGNIVQIIGAVVDVEFPRGSVPKIYDALRIDENGLTLEVQQQPVSYTHLDVYKRQAQYRELAAFAQFASDLDETTRKQLERGQRVTELMKQKQYSPMSVAEMGVSLFAVERGYLDDIALNKIGAFEAELLAHARTHYAELIAKINATVT